MCIRNFIFLADIYIYHKLQRANWLFKLEKIYIKLYTAELFSKSLLQNGEPIEQYS